MAIPIGVTITCPTCGTSENETYGDVSVGPQGQTSDLPHYSMFTKPLWTQTHRDGETYLSCTTCGEAEFDTLALLAVHRGRPQQDTKT